MQGQVIDGKYRLDHLIAEGGMGVVFLATHVGLEQQVAIKFIRPELSQKNDVVLRFLNEARAAAQLASDHIARVIDSGRTASGVPYLVMEHLLGEDLGSVIERRGPIPMQEATGYILQACEALAVAHAARIVHRDIKPENLFVTTDKANRRVIKVLDFGISKRLLLEPAPGLTLPGTSLGSPEYMSPEQMGGGAVDSRADIWSLGVVLYELLVGKRPFEGLSFAETCAAVLRDDVPPPSRTNRGIDPALDRVVARCLQKAPARRYASVAELARDLEPFATAEPTPSQRAFAALGVRASATRSRSEGALHPVVVTSFQGAPRRKLPKRALMLAALSSTLVLAVGLASAAAFTDRGGSSSRAAGLQSIVPELESLAHGWIEPPPLGPDVPAEDDGRMRDPGLLAIPSPPLEAQGARAEHQGAFKPKPAFATAPAKLPVRPDARPGLSPSEVKARYRAWLHSQGLKRLSEVDAAGKAAADAVRATAAEVAAATPAPAANGAVESALAPDATLR